MSEELLANLINEIKKNPNFLNQLKEAVENIPEKRKRGRPKKNSEQPKIAPYGWKHLPQPFVNNYVDDKDLHADDREFDRKHPIKQITPKPVTKAKKICVTCRSCGKTNEVWEREVITKFEGENVAYTCNSCSRRS